MILQNGEENKVENKRENYLHRNYKEQEYNK